MDRAVAQAAAVFMARVMEVAALIPAFRATKIIRVDIIKATRVVITSNPAKGGSSSSNSGIKVILSS